MAKFLGTTGLQRLIQWIKNYAKITVNNNVSTITIGDNSITPLTEHQDISGKVDKTTTVNGHALSGNVTVTASDIGVAAGAEVNQNAFSNVKVGTTTVAADSKTDTLTLEAGGDVTLTPDATNDKITISVTTPKKTSDITNDSGFITIADVPEGAAASSTTPKMDGTGAVGTETAFARGDHQHPSDTTKANKSELTITAGTGTNADKTTIQLKTGTSATVLTAHQDISGKANKSEMSVSTSEDKTTITLKSGTSATVLNAHQDISGKADKVTNATEGNVVTLDANGNLVDSGKSASSIGTDTKNTTGSTADSAKLYIVGAKEQSANPQTYSQANAYVTAGKVYSNAKEVVNLSDTQALTNKTYNGYTLGAACAKAVDTSIASGSTSTNVPTSQAVANAIAAAQVGAATFQGTAPTTFAPTNYKKGYYWVVATAGTYAGETCEPGDMIFCIADYSSAYSASDFSVVQNNVIEMTAADVDAAIAAADE